MSPVLLFLGLTLYGLITLAFWGGALYLGNYARRIYIETRREQ